MRLFFIIVSTLEIIETIKDIDVYNKILFYGSFSFIEVNEANFIQKELYDIL